MTRHHHAGFLDECEVPDPMSRRDWLTVAGLTGFLVLAWVGIFGLIVAVALVLR